MAEDVEKYCANCITCIRYRHKPQKQESVPVKRKDVECWQEIMIDIEGPSTPSDRSGNVYVLTYMCLVCRQPLLEPLRRLDHHEVRRAFSRCVFRSGTIPILLRSDRGQEFKNSYIREFLALAGVRQRYGTQWRPVEQGPVERMHQEMQKILSLLVHDVCKCHPDEWSEMLPVVEFLIYNTPGPHGYTPRDLDRRWSSGIELERES